MPCGSSLLVVHQDQIVYQTKNNLFNPKPQYIRNQDSSSQQFRRFLDRRKYTVKSVGPVYHINIIIFFI